MHSTRIFEGPSSTTFFFDGEDLLIVNAEGEEARLDRQKLQGFLLYLAERAIALQVEAAAGSSKPPQLIPTVTLGACSLIFEVDAVLVLGIEGTAAWVPFKDLRAVIKHLMPRSSISDIPDRASGLRRPPEP
jgi:hypothetical protein